jgi:hypothetical protein
MIYLDLLLALAIVLWLAFGAAPLSLGSLAMSLIGAAVAIVVFHYVVGRLAGWVIDAVIGFGEPKLASRRRMAKGKAFKIRDERELEELDDDALKARVEQHPGDALAIEISCERLAAAGNWAEYAREMEYFLTIAKDLTHDEICTRYHRLADVYLNELNRPDRAREMLHAITSQFPRHYQATLARKRLHWLDEGVRGGVGVWDREG